MADDRPLIPALDPATGEIVERPMTDDELAEWEAGRAGREAGALAATRDRVGARVRGELAATDQWVIRAHEEGRELEADRKAYRQQLRDLLAELATSTDIDALDALDLPEPPPFVQGRPVPDAAAVADAAAAAVNVTAAALAPGTAADQRAAVVDQARTAAAAALDRP